MSQVEAKLATDANPAPHAIGELEAAVGELEAADPDVKPSTHVHRKDSRLSATQLDLVASYKPAFSEEVYRLDPQLTGSNQSTLTKWKKATTAALLATGEFDTLPKGDAHAVSQC